MDIAPPLSHLMQIVSVFSPFHIWTQPPSLSLSYYANSSFSVFTVSHMDIAPLSLSLPLSLLSYSDSFSVFTISHMDIAPLSLSLILCRQYSFTVFSCFTYRHSLSFILCRQQFQCFHHFTYGHSLSLCHSSYTDSFSVFTISHMDIASLSLILCRQYHFSVFTISHMDIVCLSCIMQIVPFQCFHHFTYGHSPSLSPLSLSLVLCRQFQCFHHFTYGHSPLSLSLILCRQQFQCFHHFTYGHSPPLSLSCLMQIVVSVFSPFHIWTQPLSLSLSSYTDSFSVFTISHMDIASLFILCRQQFQCFHHFTYGHSLSLSLILHRQFQCFHHFTYGHSLSLILCRQYHFSVFTISHMDIVSLSCIMQIVPFQCFHHFTYGHSLSLSPPLSLSCIMQIVPFQCFHHFTYGHSLSLSVSLVLCRQYSFSVFTISHMDIASLSYYVESTISVFSPFHI